MASVSRNSVSKDLERLFNSGVVSGLSEGQLLDRFVTQSDSAAFEALVRRHGPMVMGVCKRWLRDPNDVDDAFQATFLVLVRKANSLKRKELVGNWLYGVAYKVAARSRAKAVRRGATEVSFAEVDGFAATSQFPNGLRQTLPELHEEVHRLPEKYRTLVVLCFLEGQTHEEAAQQLGCPLGTVKGRLARAKDLLRTRLVRRGVTLASGVSVADLLIPDVSAAVSASLVYSTVRAATFVATAKTTTAALGTISMSAVGLSEGVAHAMTLTSLKTTIAATFLAGTLLTGTAVLAFQSQEEPGKRARGVAKGSSGIPSSAGQSPGGAGEVSTSKVAAPASKAAASAGAGVGSGQSAATARIPGPMMGGGMAGGMGMGGMMAAMAGAGMSEGQQRVEAARLASSIAQNDNSPRTKAIMQKLEEPIVMNFANETPLEDVLKYIKSAATGSNNAPFPIYVDPVGLSEADKTMKSTVLIDMDGVPLKTSLRLVLKQLGLAYCIRDGVLMISNVEGILQELKEAEAERNEAEHRGFR